MRRSSSFAIWVPPISWVKSVKPAEVEASASSGFGPPQAVVYGLTYGDIRTIENSIPGVTNVIASRIIKKNVWHLGRSMNTDVVGTTVDYPVSRNYNLRTGRFSPNPRRERMPTSWCSVMRWLSSFYPIDNPLDKSLRIDGDYYDIIGIMESEGYSNLGQNRAGSSNAAPSRIFMPITSSRSRFGETSTRRLLAGLNQKPLSCTKQLSRWTVRTPLSK